MQRCCSLLTVPETFLQLRYIVVVFETVNLL